MLIYLNGAGRDRRYVSPGALCVRQQHLDFCSAFQQGITVMKRAILCAALAASAFLGATTAARAEDGQMRVRLGDLNLTTAEGAKIALARIHSQAGNFCEVASGRQSLERTGVAQRCVTDMTHKSVAQLNAPLVTALLERSLDQPVAPVALARK